MRASKFVFLALSLCLVLFASDGSATGQKLVLVGGHLNDYNVKIYQTFLNMASSSEDPHIGVITCAGGDSAPDNGQFYTKYVFQGNYGVYNAAWIDIDINHTDRAWDKKYVEMVSRLDGIFFGGGDQMDLIACFYKKDKNGNYTESPVLAQIRELYNAGKLALAGTSAGADIHQKAPMVLGGESYQALLDGSATSSGKDFRGVTYLPHGGFGFFQAGFLDTHFGTRGRVGRMIRLMVDLNTSKVSQDYFGFGIDENTALVINGNQGILTGETGMFIVNTTKATLKKNDDGSQEIKGVLISYLTEGDILNLDTKQITFASWKQNISGREQSQYVQHPSRDIFSSPEDENIFGRIGSRAFTYASQDLFNSSDSSQTLGYAFEGPPMIEVVMSKSNDLNSEGFIAFKGDIRYISYTNMGVDIKIQAPASPVDEFLPIFDFQSLRKSRPNFQSSANQSTPALDSLLDLKKKTDEKGDSQMGAV